MCARRRTFFSCVAKKRRQKKATPLSASLRCASGNLRCSRPAGSRSNSLRFTALKQSRALIRWPLCSSAHTEGLGSRTTNIPSDHRCARHHLAGACASRCADRVERSDDPCGCWDVRLFGYPPPVAAPAAGRLRGGMGVVAPMLRELTRCGCLSGAATQRSEFRSAPRNRPDAGLPLRKAKGSQTWGRLFFAYFLLAKQKKVSRPPGRQPGSRPTHRHAARSTHRPRLRQAQPERTGGELDRCPETPRSIITNHYKFNSCLRLLHKR